MSRCPLSTTSLHVIPVDREQISVTRIPHIDHSTIYLQRKEEKDLAARINLCIEEAHLLESLIWEANWAKVHAIGTAKLGIYRFGSMRGSDDLYRVGIFKSSGRKELGEGPYIVAQFSTEPTGELMVSAILQVGSASYSSAADRV
jgi:hypothetical protein